MGYYIEITVICISVFVGIVIAIILGMLIARKVSKSRQNKKRATLLKTNEDKFNNELAEKQITRQVSIFIKESYEKGNYIYTRHVFNLTIDYIKQIIMLCSFEIEPYKSYCYSFSEILSAKIIDGVKTSKKESSTVGIAGGDSILTGFAHTTTHETTFIEKIKLKIENSNPYMPGQLIPLYEGKISTTSEDYQQLTKTIEDIESILNKISLINKK